MDTANWEVIKKRLFLCQICINGLILCAETTISLMTKEILLTEHSEADRISENYAWE